MIFVSVGTFVHGFDELVIAADEVASSLRLEGLAQIGHSFVEPRHLRWERFMSATAMRAGMHAARLIVCHGGMGILGEAMRASRPIVIVPRRGATTPGHPANDQLAFVERLATIHPILYCAEPDDLARVVDEALDRLPARVPYHLGHDVTDILVRFLRSGTAGEAHSPD